MGTHHAQRQPLSRTHLDLRLVPKYGYEQTEQSKFAMGGPPNILSSAAGMITV